MSVTTDALNSDPVTTKVTCIVRRLVPIMAQISKTIDRLVGSVVCDGIKYLRCAVGGSIQMGVASGPGVGLWHFERLYR